MTAHSLDKARRLGFLRKPIRPRLRFVQLRAPGRENAGDGRSLALHRVDLDAPAMQLDERTHDRQAKADTAMPRARSLRLEPFEHVFEKIRRNSAALIAHR